ncbi:MAG: hypothetical protein Alpg2KO_05820 [Alphaproteobacteria bacterium]
MDKPRLVILDSANLTRQEQQIATRVTRGLRGQEPPLLLVPFMNRMAGSPGGGVLVPVHLAGDRPKWEETRQSALKALKRGQDVVLMGSVHTGPGPDWVKSLAATSGATVIGHRITGQASETPPKDHEPDHDWPLMPCQRSDGGAAAARKLVAAIEDIQPGRPALAPDGLPQRPALYVIEDNYSTRRNVLTQQMHADSYALVLDIAQQRKYLLESPRYKGKAFSKRRQRNLVIDLWDSIEADAAAALRSNRAVILSGTDMRDDTTRAVVNLLARLTDGELRQIRVVGQDQGQEQQAQDTADGFMTLQWPEAPTLKQSAERFAQQILVSGQEPDLDDLLDLPPAPRRRRLRTALAARRPCP